jgi:hypothetical protein
MSGIAHGGPRGLRRANARRSDQDGRRAWLPGNDGKPQGRAEPDWRQGNCGNGRRVGRPRDFLRKNADCGMQRRAARAGAEGAIAAGAGRRVVGAMIEARPRAMKGAGNSRLTGRRSASGVVSTRLRNDRMSGKRRQAGRRKGARLASSLSRNSDSNRIQGGRTHVMSQG